MRSSIRIFIVMMLIFALLVGSSGIAAADAYQLVEDPENDRFFVVLNTNDLEAGGEYELTLDPVESDNEFTVEMVDTTLPSEGECTTGFDMRLSSAITDTDRNSDYRVCTKDTPHGTIVIDNTVRK